MLGFRRGFLPERLLEELPGARTRIMKLAFDIEP